MASTDQQAAPATAAESTRCANCGAELAPDQRYCLSCGTRRGDPRVPLAGPPAEQARAAADAQAARPADVSPLAAVIGIALLGGMLLIGVLIGRGDTSDDPPPAAVVQVDESGRATTSPAETTGDGTATGGEVTSEWPAGTDGFTIQLATLPKAEATPEAVEAERQAALDDGAPGASILDSDLYATLPPDNYVIYSGVYLGENEAEDGLAALGSSFPDATVVQVAESPDSAPSGSEEETLEGATAPREGSDAGATGGVLEEGK